tara:strand:+ start:98 stop:316 length:219 start_codon:yes stop_codon:yes gene_type:complete
MATKKITADQLENLVKDCRSIIKDYMKSKDLSVHAFAVLTGVHPNQMYLFIKGDRGLNLTTMQKIGKIVAKD